MELPYRVLNTNSPYIFQIFREPTENDALLREHLVDDDGVIAPKQRRNPIVPETYHTYLLMDSNNEVMKTFRNISTYEVEEEGVTVKKAKYIEVLNDSHLDKLEMQISELRGIVDEMTSIDIITIGTLSQAYTNVTGNGARYKLLFSDTEGNWTDGTVTLDAGTYEFTLLPKLTNVPESSNNFYVAVDMSPSSSKGSPAITEEMWKDQDKLVGTTGSENKTSIPYFLTLTEETSLEFFIKVMGGGSDVVGVDEKTRVLIKKIA